MTTCRGSIDSIETMGLVDGPGIRVVVFLNGCKLRCLYCHNPEMWCFKDKNMSVSDLVAKILRYQPYFENHGGVTFSGGEPLLQAEFLIEVSKELKKHHVSLALDTAGVGSKNVEELLSYMDLVIFDVKHVEKEAYFHLTGYSIESSLEFLKLCQKLKKKLWIRQVIVPDIHDTKKYMDKLLSFLKPIKNIEKIEFLPYHTMGVNKYIKLSLPYPLKETPPMDEQKCNDLYQYFIKKRAII